jgi:hypothetical protein
MWVCGIDVCDERARERKGKASKRLRLTYSPKTNRGGQKAMIPSSPFLRDRSLFLGEKRRSMK